MKRFLLLSLFMLVVPAECSAQKLELPVEIKGDVGAFVKVEARTDGKIVYWVAMDGGLNVFPNDLLKTTTATVVTAGRPGKYRLLAYTALGDKPSEPAITTIVIEGSAPPPIPPDPPGPTPPPNPPTPDALELDLRRLYQSDPDLGKQTCLVSLKTIYEAAAAPGGCATDVHIETAGQLSTFLRDQANKTVGLTCLSEVRKRIAEELRKTLGNDATARLTPPMRDKSVSEFQRIAKALERINK